MLCLCFTINWSRSGCRFNVLNLKLNLKFIFPCHDLFCARLAKISPRMHCSMPTQSHFRPLSLSPCICQLQQFDLLRFFQALNCFCCFFWLRYQCTVDKWNTTFINSIRIATTYEVFQWKQEMTFDVFLFVCFVFWWMNRNK